LRLTVLFTDIRLHDRQGLDRNATTDVARACRAYERWGDDCADRLIGDFAFALKEERSGRVFAARDPLGAKPLYYRVSRGAISFAGTAAGIGATDGLPLELDETRIADVLVPELEARDRTSTFYRDVLRLPPGHRLVFDGRHAIVTPYWRPDPSRELRLASDDDHVEAFRDVFGEAVRCRADGAAGSMLSGGLDSSAIVGFASALRRREGGAPLSTISAVSDDPACEESRCVRSVLTLPGLDPSVVRPSEIDGFRDVVAGFLSSMEEPFDASMVLPLVVYAAARRRGLTAVLDGVDGDCVASLEPDYLGGLLSGGSWGTALREARGVARFYRGTHAPWSSAPRLILANAGRAWAPELVRAASRRLRRSGRLSAALSDTIASDELVERAGLRDRLEALWAHRASPARSPRERHAIELTHPNIGAALERYHRVAASQGIEARHPFMDRRVVELCLALPWDLKVRGGWSKFIVRRACAGLLPDEVSWRRGRWVRLGPRFLAAAVATSGAFIAREAEEGFAQLAPYVDRGKLRRLWTAFRRGDDPSVAETVWQAAALNCWVRNFTATRYDPPSRANGPAALPCAPSAGLRGFQQQET
jgi:asparagine synthase (glutamine-hydrolysing)